MTTWCSETVRIWRIKHLLAKQEARVPLNITLNRLKVKCCPSLVQAWAFWNKYNTGPQGLHWDLKAGWKKLEVCTVHQGWLWRVNETRIKRMLHSEYLWSPTSLLSQGFCAWVIWPVCEVDHSCHWVPLLIFNVTLFPYSTMLSWHGTYM